MVFLCLANFWASQYNDIQLKQSENKSWPLTVEQCDQSCLPCRTTPNFPHIYWQVHQYYNLSINLSIPLRIPPIAGLRYLLVCLYYSWKLNFWFEFETASQPGFEPVSLGPKAVKGTIELTPHYSFFYSWFPLFFSFFVNYLSLAILLVNKHGQIGFKISV